MTDEKNTPFENEQDLTTEANEQKAQAAKAAEETQKAREAFEGGEVGKEHPHEDKDTSYMEEKAPKISIIKILKYIVYGIILFIFLLLLWRIFTQKEDYGDHFVWTEEAVAKYNELGNLTVWTQDMSSFTFTLERDENNIPTNSYEYTYSPYSTKDSADPNNQKNPRNVFEGVFMVSDPMYIEETEQLIVTLRVNRTAKDRLMSHYALSNTPSNDSFIFFLSDGVNTYTDYEYVTFEKNTYFYYRLVFNDVAYSYLKDYESVTEADIVSLTLNVYYKNLYLVDSPIATMTVGNNLIGGDAFDEKDHLPATTPADLQEGFAWIKKED